MSKRKWIVSSCLLMSLLAGSNAWAGGIVGETTISSCALNAGVLSDTSTDPHTKTFTGSEVYASCTS